MAERVSAEREIEIIAHRGASVTRPENSMAAVEQALVEQSDWVEIDVQETADGQIVVAHDSDFMKMAGIDLKVWNATMADLAGIDIGSWFDPAYAAEHTPTLREVKPALARQVMGARNDLSAPERLLLWISDRFRLKNLDLVAEEADA
ncbi:hypothetical protein G3I74_01655 [Wenzhouxiangella sp. C33]|uniref:GP-PDE domain-containing protein n=2 Tax=Wenzhouxiangella limi TaxID=2707351 RepID=A0A845V359_9GAMM|nr:hypothetical protein [Wenzhouxiangella limi]